MEGYITFYLTSTTKSDEIESSESLTFLTGHLPRTFISDISLPDNLSRSSTGRRVNENARHENAGHEFGGTHDISPSVIFTPCISVNPCRVVGHFP